VNRDKDRTWIAVALVGAESTVSRVSACCIARSYSGASTAQAVINAERTSNTRAWRRRYRIANHTTTPRTPIPPCRRQPPTDPAAKGRSTTRLDVEVGERPRPIRG